jgi:hypothetical protein
MQSERVSLLQEKGRERCFRSRDQTSLANPQWIKRWWTSSPEQRHSKQMPGPSQPRLRSTSQVNILPFPASQRNSFNFSGMVHFHSWKNQEESALRKLCVRRAAYKFFTVRVPEGFYINNFLTFNFLNFLHIQPQILIFSLFSLMSLFNNCREVSVKQL